jgi:hypothetical protein
VLIARLVSGGAAEQAGLERERHHYEFG